MSRSAMIYNAFTEQDFRFISLALKFDAILYDKDLNLLKKRSIADDIAIL